MDDEVDILVWSCAINQCFAYPPKCSDFTCQAMRKAKALEKKKKEPCALYALLSEHPKLGPCMCMRACTFALGCFCCPL